MRSMLLLLALSALRSQSLTTIAGTGYDQGFCCKLDASIWYGELVSQKRPALFRGRHFQGW
jgi:hypothetical protein